jgi:hypothetical protein
MKLLGVWIALVGIVGRPGFHSQQGQETFLFSTVSRLTLWPIQPPIQWVLAVLSPEVTQPGCEADHSPLSSAKAEEWWSYTSTPSYLLMVSGTASPLPFTGYITLTSFVKKHLFISGFHHALFTFT